MTLIARKEEQNLLNQALCKQESQFIAVYGRRGVGKTYLIREMFSGGWKLRPYVTTSAEI